MGKSVYEMITDRIIAQLEEGIIPWQKPWTGVMSGAYNRISKKPYSLLNQMMLLHDGEYASFKLGSQDYSKEELVAEIGSANILNQLGIETAKSFKNSTAYIQSWLKVLKNDVRFIVSESSKAEKAVKYILGEEIEASV